MNKSIIAALLSAAFLGGCGGGGSDGSTADTPAQAGTSTGVLIDGPVAGVQYTTSGGYSGVTGANGSYAFNPGETVTFRIGAINLGTVTATGTVTPLDLAAAATNKENVATNLLVLLQSLDADGDASNGITINDTTKAAAASASAIDLTQAPATFASSSNSALTSVMNSAGVPKTAPVSEAEALEHFKSEFFKQLAGAWTAVNAEGAIAIRFDASGNYIIGETGVADDAGNPGSEVGSINWDPKTGKVSSASIVQDSNGEWGLNQANGSEIFKVDGDKFTVTDEDGTVTTFERVKNDAAAPIVGMWALGSNSTMNTQTFTFYANGTYLMADPVGDDACGSPGVEYGTYSFNATTGVFAVTSAASVDTNGCAGLWDDVDNVGSSFSVEFSDDKSTATLIEPLAAPEDRVVLHRVSK